MHNRLSFLRSHSEALVVGTVLLVVAAVFHWVPYQIAFLNFFYLPVFAAGYLLGARTATATSVLCVLMVLIYYLWVWAQNALASGRGFSRLLYVAGENWETLLNLSMWSGFLIIIGSTFARVHERMTEANSRLEQQAAEFRELNEELQETTTDLRQKSDQLQEKNLQVEQLKQQSEQILYTTMDPVVARMVIQGRLRQEKRTLSVMFCDLKGFTSYAHEHHPEVILQDLNQFYEAVEKVVETYHGHIDKYMGDGIMCEFGAPVDYEQHRLQAVVAALKIQEKFEAQFREGTFPWQLRIGLASGESIVGLMGKRRRSYSVIGQVVNLAKRLEEMAEPGCIYIDEDLHQGLQHLVEIRQVRSLAPRRAENRRILEEIAEKEQQLQHEPQNASLLFQIGQLYFRLQEASRAIGYFERALELDPQNNDVKLAYADASLKRDEYEKLMIRGLSEKRAVFEAVRLRNPLLDRKRFPKHFSDRYRQVENLIEVPEDVVLPVEVIDGSVGHSLCVAVVAYALADQMGLEEELKRNLLVAARLQDSGKAIVWHHVLNRRGGLSDQERKDLENHVSESATMARRMGYDHPEVIEIIANHHELLNGTGYPKGAHGADIPLGGRISGVADVYCALTGWRPYREPWDSRIALSELGNGAAEGKYDPKVVTALSQLML